MDWRTRVLTLSVLCSALFATGAFAAEPGRSAGGKSPLKNVYFGEQHMHIGVAAASSAVLQFEGT